MNFEEWFREKHPKEYAMLYMEYESENEEKTKSI